MLFLFNKTIVEVLSPELYLAKNWRRIGCGDPVRIMAGDAVNFATMVVNEHMEEGIDIDLQTQQDIAALLIAKTGANAALFTGANQAKLNILDEAILQGLRNQIGASAKAETLWTDAA